MYHNPPLTVDECEFCDWVGKAFSDMFSIFLDLELLRGTWTSMEYFDDIGGWDIVAEFVPEEFREIAPDFIKKLFKFLSDDSPHYPEVQSARHPRVQLHLQTVNKLVRKV